MPKITLAGDLRSIFELNKDYSEDAHAKVLVYLKGKLKGSTK